MACSAQAPVKPQVPSMHTKFLVVLAYGFCTSVDAASSLLSDTELSFIFSSKRSALVKVFIDSDKDAPESDVDQVLAMLPSLAKNAKELFPLLARLYTEQCRERLPSAAISDYEVCPFVMKTNTEFDECVSRMPVQSAFLFYLLPPGAFRDAVRQHLLNNPNSSGDFLVHCKTPEFENTYDYPYWEALEKERPFFEEYLTLNSLNPLLEKYRYRRPAPWSADDTTGWLSDDFDPKTCFVSALLPAELHAYILETLMKAAPQKFELIMSLEVLRLIRPITTPNTSVMLTLGTTIKSALNEAKSSSDAAVIFEAILKKVLEWNPEALILSPTTIKLSAFHSYLPLIINTLMEAAVKKKIEGRLSRSVDLDDEKTKAWLLMILDMIECEWSRAHYRHILFSPSSVPMGKQSESGDSSFSVARPVYREGLHMDTMNLLPQPSALLNSSFRQNWYSDTLSNPHIFFRIITDSCSQEMITTTIADFKSGFEPFEVSAVDSQLANNIFKIVLNEKLKSEIDILSFQRSRKLCHLKSRKEPNYKQRVVMNSLVFRVGAFKASSHDTGMKELEAVATVFFPLYMSKLRKASATGLYNIENMFMCPFIDKGWLLEYYGNIFVPINDPTCVLRLLYKTEHNVLDELRKYVTKLFSLERSEYDTHSVRTRVVELIRYLEQKGDIELIMNLVSGLIHHQETLIWALNVTRSNEVIRIECGERELLIAYLTEFPAIDNVENYRFTVPMALSYPRAPAFALLADILSKTPSGIADQYSFNLSKDLISRPDVTEDLILGHSQVNTHEEANRAMSLIVGHLPTSRPKVRIINKIFQLNCSKKLKASLARMSPIEPELSLEFKIFRAWHRLNGYATSYNTQALALFDAWWPIFRATNDAVNATAVILDKAPRERMETGEEMEDLLYSHVDHFQAAEFVEDQSVPFSALLQNTPSPSQGIIYVNGVQLYLPSNADITHLYAVVQIVLKKTTPFRLISADDGTIIPHSKPVMVTELAHLQLFTQNYNIFSEICPHWGKRADSEDQE